MQMKLPFVKMSGAGNDFIVIDNRKRVIRNAPYLAKRVCDRYFGIGGDGLLLVERSRAADYRMMYYNADGSYGGMCGNGGRCIARFAVDHGIVGRKHSFDALGYVYLANVADKTVTLRMKDSTSPQGSRDLTILGRKRTLFFVDTGSPHVVTRVGKGGLAGINVEKEGPVIRFHKRFSPIGANVNFVEVHSLNCIAIRTYERGVEAETRACGTGSIASAIVAATMWGCKPPLKVVTRSNQQLVVGFKSQGVAITDVYLTGPATISYEGTINV